MRNDAIFQILTGPSIHRLIQSHSKMIEEWNDYYKSSDRDRLGSKEARFQALLFQALERAGYDVIVQSYLDQSKSIRQSCDLFATKPHGKRRYWIEIKRECVDQSGGYGGANLIRQVLSDVGKIKYGKSNGDRVIVWIGFWGSAEAVSECVALNSTRYTFRIRSIRPSHLRNAWKSGHTKTSTSKVKKVLANFGKGSVTQALHDLHRWIKANGGKSKVMKVTRPCDDNLKGRVAYGLLCGMMP